MHRFLMFAAVLISPLFAVALGGGLGQNAWDPHEADSDLFASDRVFKAPSFLNTAATLGKWDQLALLSPAQQLAPSGSGTMTTRMYAATSYNPAGGDDSNGKCSVNSNVPVNPPTNNTEQWCSTNAMPSIPGTDGSDCSTTDSDPTHSGAVCSAVFDGPTGNNPNPLYCSTGSQGTKDATNVFTCSVSGGVTGAGTNGNVACSAGWSQDNTPTQMTCSTNGDMANPASGMVTCSAFAGEHEECSAGMANDTNDHTTCSANAGATAGQNFCSVTQPGPNDAAKDGNKCSAMNMPQPGQGQNGTRACSVITKDGSNSSDWCSIGANVPANDNAACTVMTMGTTGTDPGPPQAQCSVIPPTAVLTAGGCSIKNGDGTVTGPTNGLCGTMHGHHGTPKPQTTQE